jgi:hypothetical protein
MDHLRQLDPNARVSGIKNRIPLPAVDRARYEEGLRKAGLPE